MRMAGTAGKRDLWHAVHPPPESTEKREEFKQVDLIRNGLIGNEDASHRRDELGKILGIGYGNAKQFLSRLNNYGVSREEFEQALTQI